MKAGGVALWALLTAVLVLVPAVGCGTKQAVKSTESVAPQQQAAPAPETAATPQASAPAQEPIKSEDVPGAAKQAAEAQKATEIARAGSAEAGIAATQEKPSSFQDIRFDFDKALIRDDAKPILSKIAEAAKAARGGRLVIEGHCDERGTAEYNMALGERRAESARAYLVSLGVPAAMLSTVSFGKEKPLDPEHSEDAWAKNRRAHFVPK